MSNKLLEIQKSINSLSLDEKKSLLNHLTQEINQNITEQQMQIMANHPEIQAEIALINKEFMTTEMDGIDN
ncbi:hypothetical protein A5482_011195 [Cyanobacterium sp. IPPAS B-1200]|uniref:hypothetical protein n=1 Tax=Cyanobacterium sp. IPPAS B-1200 TaxID=1562720 RepID=UPI00085288A5|nr:hypothetical protein [Cyanobacterium sp. IPPAS B-1200]OEJ80106.1 hypothetical protein A5482_07360 [Cyanobacterium sp. IPPAS B-1200]